MLKGGVMVPFQPPIVLNTTTSPAAAQRFSGRYVVTVSGVPALGTKNAWLVTSTW